MSNDYGLKVSKTGYDVLTADKTQLAYSSVYSNFKIHSILTCTVTLTGASTTGSGTVSNPLTYKNPVHIPYCNPSTLSGVWRMGNMNGTVNSDDSNWAAAFVLYNPTTDQFECYISHLGSGTRTFTFKIVVFADVFTGVGDELPAVDDYGLKISKTGKSVTSFLDSEMGATSKFRSLTLANGGTGTMDTTVGNSRTSVSHGLGRVPIFLLYASQHDSSDYVMIPNSGSDHGSSHHYEGWATSSAVFGDAFCSATEIHTFRYLIFNETLV